MKKNKIPVEFPIEYGGKVIGSTIVYTDKYTPEFMIVNDITFEDLKKDSEKQNDIIITGRDITGKELL
jgi:hypothetical protein